MPHHRHTAAVALVLALLLVPATGLAQAPAPTLTDAEMERFLLNARVVSTKPIGIGVTDSLRATLTDGTLTHDAHIQVIDEFKDQQRTSRGTEIHFRDSWRYNVAAYRIDRMIDLRLVPVSIERRWNGSAAAFTWWVDDVMMDEKKRIAKQMVAPNFGCWTEQSQALRMFDQLIENTDRNLGNTLITSTWRVWAIDHTRAFRRSTRPHTGDLTSIDRRVLERLASLDFNTLKDQIGRYVGADEIRKLLSRRDALVAHYRSLGDTAVITRTDPSVACNVTRHTNNAAPRIDSK